MSSPSPQFRFNPITGQLDLSDDHGTGPGGNIDITADEGGTISAQVFSMLGKMAGSAQVMTTLLEGGILNWENRTWETPYVVDTNATPGLRGTFTTIQAALDAAVLDGMTYTNPKKIVLRNAAYVEDLNIPGGAYFFGSCIMGGPTQYVLPLSITGNHTFDAVGTFYSNGVYWVTPTGVMFSGGGTIGLIQAVNSVFWAADDKFFDVSGNFNLECFYCQFIGDAGNSVQLEFNGVANFFSCDLGSTLCTSTGSIPRFYNCTSVGSCTVNGGAYFAYNTLFTSGNATGPNITQIGSQPMIFDNCNFANNTNTYAIDSDQMVQIVNCYAQTNLGNLIDLLSPTTTSGQVMSTVGNVLKGVRTDADLVLSGFEAYLGVTDTSAARAITLRPSWKDYQVYVVDESGAAGTNNITVDVVGGGLINGASSIVINQNWGAILFHQINATDFIAISSTISSGGGSITLTPDVGSAITASSIPVQGQAFNSAKVMETASDTGALLIANNTWDTAYVVDQSTTFGEKGTFATLQDAIDAIVADGVATSDLAGLIRMRPGVYTYGSPVTIPDNVIIAIKGDTPSGGVGGTNWQADVYLNANLVAGSATVYLYNLFLNADVGDAFTSTSGNIYIFNSTVNNATVGGFINLQGAYGSFVVDGGNLRAFACNQLYIQLDSGSAYMKQCGDISVVQNAGQVIVWGATGLTASGSPGAGSSFWAYDVPVSSMITVTAERFYAGNLSANSAGLQGGGRFFDPGIFVQQIQRLKANCYVSRIVSTSDAISQFDYFVGVQGNSGPVTLTIQATGLTKGCPWQSWRVADLEGTASTSPITISCNDGNINNNPTYVISKNFGSIEIYFDGTDFFITSNTSNEEFSEPIGELAYFANKNGDTYLSGVWLKCDGSVLSQATYPVLYSRMGLINEGGINWTLRTSGTTSTLRAATFGASKHLVAGDFGILRSSTDGITWATRTSGFNGTIQSLTFGGGNFIYGGSLGSLATSTDGITWQTKNPSIGSTLNPNQGTFGPWMAYGAGVFVGAVSNNGGLVSSTDGITWTTRDNSLNSTATCGGVVYGAGLFAANYDNGNVVTSTDGVTWTAQTTGTTSTLRSLAFINSTFVSGVTGDAGNVLTSTDGITWTSRVTGIASGNATNCAFYGVGQYWVWTGSGARSSTDLVTWNAIAGSPGTMNCGVFNGTLLVGGQNAGVIKTSTDGVTWTTRTSNTTSTITALIWTGSLHLYGDSAGKIGTSTDGITWTLQTSGTTSTIMSLLYDGTLYHASVLHSTLTSTDAVTWTTNTGYSGTTSTILSTAYGNSTYVYGTVGGRIATSADTMAWTGQTSGTTSNVNALRYGTVFVYGTVGGGLSTSTDGVTWTARTSGTTSDINALTYGALYVYAGVGGVLASSTDAITWTTRTSGTTSNLNTLRYANDFYIAAGVGGVTIQSNGAVTWYSRVSATTSTIFASSTGAGVFVEAGNAGAIQTALNEYPYNRSTQFQLPTDNAFLITTEAATNFFRSLYIKALN